MIKNYYKIAQQLKILLIISVITFYSCKPKVEEPSITNCLLTKVDRLDVSDKIINKNPIRIISPSSTFFDYDQNNKPIKFSYFNNTGLYKYEEVHYDTKGDLTSGQAFDLSGTKTNDITYKFTNNKLSSRNEVDNTGFPTISQQFYYDSTGRLSQQIKLLLNYTDDTHTNYYFTGYIYRYQYDNNNNSLVRYSKYAKSNNNITDYNSFAATLVGATEYVNIKLSNYDNKFNPYRSDPTLAIIFDDFPSVNNAANVSYFYVNSGVKYADFTYKYQYNKKGFPFLYTVSTVYSDEYKTNTNVKDYTSSSSIEYKCK